MIRKQSLLLAASYIFIACMATGIPATLFAADITDVVDAADGADPFDAKIDIHFRQEAGHSLMLRERNVMDVRGGSIPGESINQGEYDYWFETNYLDINLALGLYHDLEFHVKIPVVLTKSEKYSQSSHWRKKYWAGSYDVSHPITGSADRPSLMADGVTSTARQDFSAGGHIEDITMGFAWSPMNTQRDDTKPTWTLFFDMVIPVAPLRDPRDLGWDASTGQATSNPGLGEKLLRFKLGTAISKRFATADPYVGFTADLPVPVGNSLIELPQFAFTFTLGSEFIFWEVKQPQSVDPRYKIYLDMRALTTIYTKGDGYPVLTDLMGWRDGDITKFPNLSSSTTAPSYTLPREDTHVTAEYYMALKIQAYDFFKIVAFGSVGHNFEHYIAVQRTRDIQTGSRLQEPLDEEYYKDITEAGKRVKLGQSISWSWGVGTEFMF